MWRQLPLPPCFRIGRIGVTVNFLEEGVARGRRSRINCPAMPGFFVKGQWFPHRPNSLPTGERDGLASHHVGFCVRSVGRGRRALRGRLRRRHRHRQLRRTGQRSLGAGDGRPGVGSRGAMRPPVGVNSGFVQLRAARIKVDEGYFRSSSSLRAPRSSSCSTTEEHRGINVDWSRRSR